MNTAIRRIGCVLIAAAVILCAALPVYAEGNYQKDEIIYVNLTAGGGVEGIYVVNSFDMPAGGTITDHGDYSQVVNLTTTDPVLQGGNVVTATAPAGRFYYEGVLNRTDIPWEIAVDYALDGRPVGSGELAGCSGKLQMWIAIAQRAGAEQVYRDHYAVQISLSLDSALCASIEAPDATVASVGGRKQLSYILLPGKERTFTVTADVRNFEFDGISINMIPLALTIDDPDTSELKDQLCELQDGAAELDDGAFDLDDGAVRLDEGADKLADGVIRLEDGVNELTDGVGELDDGARDLFDGTGDLWDGTRELTRGAHDLDDGIYKLALGARSYTQGLAELNARSPGLVAGSAQIREGLGVLAQKTADIDEDRVTELLDQAELLQNGAAAYGAALESAIDSYRRKAEYSAHSLGYSASETEALLGMVRTLTLLQAGYEPVGDGVETMTGAIAAQAEGLPVLAGGIRELDGKYRTLDAGIAGYTQGTALLENKFIDMADGIAELVDGSEELLDGSRELKEGAYDLFDGAGELRDGVEELRDGTDELTDGVSELRDGSDELKDGTVELRDGTGELRDGTSELRDKTSDMDSRIDDKIDELLEEYRSADFTPISFVDPANTNVNAVQFVMRTASISAEEVARQAAEPQPEPTLWQRFLNLFTFWRHKENT